MNQPNKPAPPVWNWYVAMCVGLALANVGLMFLGIWVLQNDAWISREAKYPPGSLQAPAMLYIVAGVLFAIGNLILPFVPKRPWAYVLHMTNIIAAILSCCMTIPAIFILIAWTKPQAREFFDFR